MRKLVVLFVVFIFSGCATIMNGKMVTVPVTTYPPGAVAMINGVKYATPARVMVPRGQGDFKLYLLKEGYQPIYLELKETLNIWLLGNFFFLPGVVVDFVSGKAYSISPDRIDQSLMPETTNREQGALNFFLWDMENLPKEVSVRIKAGEAGKDLLSL